MDHRALYFKLFAAMADAVEYLDNEENAKAKERLIRAQQEAEERYLADGERKYA